VKEHNSILEIVTSKFHLTYDRQPFHPSGFSVVVKGFFGCHASVWRYGEVCSNLGGTARTLDEADGRIPVGPGVISRNGYTTIDDSASMLFADDGFVATRRPGERVDGYLFAYGHDYRGAIKALYAISGSQPLLPRWALGNWWSRYYAYQADEYLSLMDKFKEEGVPLSVAVIDMDWHLTEDARITEAGKTGWTGYTWNKKLFPDPPAFLKGLHDRKLKVTLNDHPADGVQSYEDSYKAMSKALNHDDSTKDPIHFDITDRAFLKAFFDVLHRPLEDDGVDFWWIDWQQGEHSRIIGIDPLWVLNHFHFIDNARNNKRPLTFSRYAGPGSHRYPVGFSGDSIVTWATLEFQPEFTATASNIGYGWWSHDIGGHMFGAKDDELGTRWLQFGVFSPIMRLHSSNNQWTAKEPWKFSIEARKVMIEFLQLRHRLLPYLYTMNTLAASAGTPIVQPMYWDFPHKDEAYRVPNQYFFGSELIVFPITSAQDPKLRLARVRGWLPPGQFVDIFSGVLYEGDREIWLSRPLGGYPVFAKQGAIIPLDAAPVPANGGENPDAFEILIVVGADGRFDILEDDDTGSVDIKYARTSIMFSQAKGTVEIGPLHGTREFALRFLAMDDPKTVTVSVNGTEQKLSTEVVPNGFVVKLGAISGQVTVGLGENPQLVRKDAACLIWPILSDAQIEFQLKEDIWQIVTNKVQVVSRLLALNMDEKLKDAVLEFIL
jgi:alpha-glucosidase (family GH31 glycosyl hydrolase)